MRRGIGSNLLLIVWLIIGVVVAQDHKYLKNVDSVEAFISLVLAILLWPLVLLDVSLRID